MVSLSLVLAAAGCGMTTKASEADEAAGNVELSVLLPDLTSDNWNTLREAAISTGQDQDIDVAPDAAPSATDATAQAARIATLAAQKPNCLGLAPVDPTKLLPALVALTKKNIPIINVGEQFNTDAAHKAGVQITTQIGPQDQEIGFLAARKMLTDVPTGSEVAMIVGRESNADEAQTRYGFTASLSHSSGKLTLITSKATNDDYTQAQQVAADLLSDNPNIRGIFANNDFAGLAALKAVRAAGMEDRVSVISVGGSQDALKAVKNHTLSATVATYPSVVGTEMVEACQLVTSGSSIQPALTTPATLVDSSNIAAELKAFPQPSERYQDPLA